MDTASAVVRTIASFEAEGEGVLKSYNYEFDALPVEDV